MADDQSATVRLLGDRSTHRARDRVRRIDTHGAIVFLAGDRAYKLKRAVRLPYLDFSTVAKRFAACAAEVTVNRRTAPELYLGVAAVTDTPDGLTLGPIRDPRRIGARDKARARDWAVVMRRFSDDALYDRIAARDGLSGEDAEAMAEAIARFHRDARKAQAAGDSRSTAWIAANNRAAIAAHTPRVFRAADVRALARDTDAAVTRVAPLLAKRRRAGLVRHGHGDLHLRNICRIDGRPVLFDALEFDARLATVDVLYDLAFLLMDMLHRDLPVAANRLLNHYLALTVDPRDPTPLDGLATLPLFLSLRAAIRAHTEATAAGTQPTRPLEAARRDDARAYLKLAIGLLKPSAPMLIAIGGLSGSGKTTLARALAPGIGAAPGALVLRSDVIRKRLAGVDSRAHLPGAAYTRRASERVYAAVSEMAVTTLRAGHSVIADAVFADPAERAAIEAVARRAGVPFAGIWLDAGRTAMAGRLRARRGDASDATPSVLAQQMTYDLGPIAWTRIAAGRSPAAVARAALRVVRRSGTPR
ncbi:MAG: AAA family ATPase [Gemmatimonas sp.]